MTGEGLWSWPPSLHLAASAGLLPCLLPDGISLSLPLLGGLGSDWYGVPLPYWLLVWFLDGFSQWEAPEKWEALDGAHGPPPCKLSPDGSIPFTEGLCSYKSALATQPFLPPTSDNYFLFSSSQVSGVCCHYSHHIL